MTKVYRFLYASPIQGSIVRRILLLVVLITAMPNAYARGRRGGYAAGGGFHARPQPQLQLPPKREPPAQNQKKVRTNTLSKCIANAHHPGCAEPSPAR